MSGGQCSSCGGFCKKSGCKRENVDTDLSAAAHEIWAMAQLSPTDGIEDAVARIVYFLSEKFQQK
jgi:hypothetical protein